MSDKRDFKDWLQTFRPSINGYGYYVDFPKVYEKAEELKIEISLLNTLIGSQDIEAEFDSLLARYPECIKAVPVLLAVRENEIYCQDENGAFTYDFNEMNQSVDQYKYFMRQTGLFELMQSHIIDNLYDYATGVEVGLNSNGRKNRGGHQMEDLVESYLKQADVEYYKEMYLNAVENKWDIDLGPISAEGTTTKRWDFVVKTPDSISAIEANFYASGGSKLNEVARSYKMIAEESKGIDGFQFIWITDGGGWVSARRNLEETFNILDTLYNISDMESGIFLELFTH